MNYLIVLLFLSLFILDSCQEVHQKSSHGSISSFLPKYAKGFSIGYYKNSTVIHTYSNTDTSSFIIDKPINRIVCLSATHIGAFCMLNARDKIIGISSKKYLFDSLLLKKSIEEIGEANQMNIEKLHSLKPDLVMLFTIDQSSSATIQKLKQLNIPYIINSEFKETSPLAQAEWIKLFGVIVNQSKMADSIFNLVEHNYRAIKEGVKFNEYKPMVLINLSWKGVWYMSGGESIIAQLIQDAGGIYAFQNLKVKGSVPLSFEQVYLKSRDADYWLNVGIAKTKAEMLYEDKNAHLFNAFEKNHIFNNNLYARLNGANDFWETGVMRPDLVLEDFKLIFSEKSPKNYYQRLN